MPSHGPVWRPLSRLTSLIIEVQPVIRDESYTIRYIVHAMTPSLLMNLSSFQTQPQTAHNTKKLSTLHQRGQRRRGHNTVKMQLWIPEGIWFNLGTRRRWVGSLMAMLLYPWYWPNRKATCALQSQCWHLWGNKNLLALLAYEPQFKWLAIL